MSKNITENLFETGRPEYTKEQMKEIRGWIKSSCQQAVDEFVEKVKAGIDKLPNAYETEWNKRVHQKAIVSCVKIIDQLKGGK